MPQSWPGRGRGREGPLEDRGRRAQGRWRGDHFSSASLGNAASPASSAKAAAGPSGSASPTHP
eukprot:4540623-Pyramimonas_sp.AAC.1